MRRRIIVSFMIALLIAVPLTVLSDKRDFQELASRAALSEQATSSGSRCPMLRSLTDSADLDPLSICVAYGIGAYEAALKYPSYAPYVFAVYGEDETFQQIFSRYGHPIVPIIAHYLESGSVAFQFRHVVRETFQQAWLGGKLNFRFSKLTPEQTGLMAIDLIAERGYEMLAEFEVVDGAAKFKPLTSLFFGAKDVLLGNVFELEKTLVRAERYPTWTEVGLAAADVALVSLGTGVAMDAARAMAGRTAGRLSLRESVAGAYGAIRGVAKGSGYAVPAALVYVAVTRPQLIASAGGWIAENLGLPQVVGIFAVYLVGISMLVRLLLPLIAGVKMTVVWWGSLRRSFGLRGVRKTSMEPTASPA